jgi:hypothetical protein
LPPVGSRFRGTEGVGSTRRDRAPKSTFVLDGSIAGISDVVGAFGWCEALEESADAPPSGLDGALGSFAQKRFELGEDLLDRVEIGAVGRQEEELGAGGSDGPSHGLAFVTAEIVDNDDVARAECRHEYLLDIGQEDLAIDRPIDHTGRIDAIGTQRGQESERAPAALRRIGDQPFAAKAAPMRARHIGLGPGLIDEDQTSWIKPALVTLPLCAPAGDVGPILLAGAQAFF